MKFVIFEKARRVNESDPDTEWKLRMGRYRNKEAALDAIEGLKQKNPDMRYRVVEQNSRFEETKPE